MKANTFKPWVIAFLGATFLFSSFAIADDAEKATRTPAGSRAEQNEEQQLPLIEELTPLAKNEEEMAEERVAQAASLYTTHPGALHQCIAVSALGDSIELHNGAIFTVRPKDRWKTLDWFTDEVITIHANDAWFSNYKYKLINQNTGHEVEVNLAYEPIYNGIYTYWIVAIDKDYNQICLNDGSIWDISAFDAKIVDGWYHNDTILIGMSSGWFSLKSNILINASTLNHVRADCTY